jgi:soluble lytic murein transglycosylase-like protein
MTSMPRRFALPAAVILFGIAGALGPISASAGVLYKCEGPNGSIAYTNKTAAFTKCVELSRYADAPVKKAAPSAGGSRAKLVEASLTKPAVTATTPAPSPPQKTTATHGWVYEENVPEKPEFNAIRAGVTSTALPLRASDFGVESTAPLVKPELPVAAMVASAKPALPAAVASTPAISVPKVLRGAVYRVARSDGITEYTNVKPAKGSAFAVLFTYIATCVACDVHSKIDFARTALNIEAFKEEIAAAASATGVDISLLRAVIHAESAFNPMAVSNKGAQGLMQLMPGTAGDLGVTDAFDVGQNIAGGAKYLAQLLRDFNGNTQLATAAYNAGEGAVQKYGGVPPYDETQVYVQRVEQLRDRYHKAL